MAKEDEFVVGIRKKIDIRAIKGLISFKVPAQKLKDEMRTEWA